MGVPTTGSAPAEHSVLHGEAGTGDSSGARLGRPGLECILEGTCRALASTGAEQRKAHHCGYCKQEGIIYIYKHLLLKIV